MKRRSYRVVIIGAGPAGSACAIELAHLGVDSVLLVDASAHDRFRIGESIPPETNGVLRQLGVFDRFLEERHEPCYGSCSWWGSHHRGYNDSILSPIGPGWHLDRRRFDAFLAREAERAGAELQLATEFLDSDPTAGDGFTLTFEVADGSTETIRGDLVVDASGARSAFAIAQGSRRINSLPLVCLGVRYHLTGGPRILSRLTHLEAVEYGWWYAARLPGEQLLVTLYSDTTTIKANRLHEPDRLLAALAQTPNIGGLVNGLQAADDSPIGFPAPSFRLDRITGRDWIAVGDAACAYDPITSQGIIKSLTTGRYAAAAVHGLLADRQSDFHSYESVVSAGYAQYLQMRTHLYRMEQRWPGARFWRRHQVEVTQRSLSRQDQPQHRSDPGGDSNDGGFDRLDRAGASGERVR